MTTKTAKTYQFSEAIDNQLSELATKLGYPKGKKMPATLLLDDILEAVLQNQELFTEDTNIKELISKGIQTTTKLKNRAVDVNRTIDAIARIESKIAFCLENNQKPTKSRLNKIHNCNYNALIEYEKNHTGIFG